MKVHLVNSPQKTRQDSSGFEFLYPPLGPVKKLSKDIVVVAGVLILQLFQLK